MRKETDNAIVFLGIGIILCGGLVWQSISSTASDNPARLSEDVLPKLSVKKELEPLSNPPVEVKQEAQIVASVKPPVAAKKKTAKKRRRKARPKCDTFSYPALNGSICVPLNPTYETDLDCPDILPYKNILVVGSDPHRFDADFDGIGCEG